MCTPYFNLIKGSRWAYAIMQLAPLFVILVVDASGHPPSDPNASWYNSLRNPTFNSDCCSMSHCHTAKYKIENDHYSVFIDTDTFGPTAPDAWLPVPEGAIIRRDNPTGEAVAC